MITDSIPSQWMVVLDYSSKLHGLQPRVGRFVRQSYCTEDMEFFGGRGPERRGRAERTRLSCVSPPG